MTPVFGGSPTTRSRKNTPEASALPGETAQVVMSAGSGNDEFGGKIFRGGR